VATAAISQWANPQEILCVRSMLTSSTAATVAAKQNRRPAKYFLMAEQMDSHSCVVLLNIQTSNQQFKKFLEPKPYDQL
jgi:hypothetical protein